MKSFYSKTVIIILLGILLGVFLIIIYRSLNKEKDFTHISIKNMNLNIWSYLPIKSIKYENEPIIQVNTPQRISVYNPVEILLNGDIKIIVSDNVTINGKLIHDNVINVFVNKRGEVRENEFIRTFH
jgi:hypothetical protein